MSYRNVFLISFIEYFFLFVGGLCVLIYSVLPRPVCSDLLIVMCTVFMVDFELNRVII